MGSSTVVYRDLYFTLFGAVADAVEALENNEPLLAKKLLIVAMREAEERIISQEENNEVFIECEQSYDP